MTAAPGAGGKLIIVTGMSGAGRSTALKAFEDMGYEAVDNRPLSLLPNLVVPTSDHLPLALGVDVRTRDFAVPALVAALDSLVEDQGLDLRIVFLDCDDDRLVRRYTETRRPHPLAAERPVGDGIRLERERVRPLRDRADLVIDTSLLNTADLKRVLHGHFHLATEHGLSIFVTSFRSAKACRATPISCSMSGSCAIRITSPGCSRFRARTAPSANTGQCFAAKTRALAGSGFALRKAAGAEGRTGEEGKKLRRHGVFEQLARLFAVRKRVKT